MNLIESRASELRLLHEAVERTWRQRNDGDEQKGAWLEACRRFQGAYDPLAFPGGLASGMALLAAKHPETIEVAIRFLEADPWFFRSGYIKAEIIRRLRQVPLTREQVRRLQDIVLARIQGPDRREFRWYCRLSRFIRGAGFKEKVEEFARASDLTTARHAEWVLAQLKD